MKKRLSVLMYKLLLVVASLSYGQTTLAAYMGQGGIQGYIIAILTLINRTLIPLIFSIALLFFLVNIARYFIIGGGDSENKEKARTYALYGIGAFVLMVGIWGIVNIFTNAFGIMQSRELCPDYLKDWCNIRDPKKSFEGTNNPFNQYRPDDPFWIRADPNTDSSMPVYPDPFDTTNDPISL